MRLWCRIGMTVRYAMGFFPTYLNKYAHQTGSWNPNFQGKRNKSLKVPIRISSSHDTFSSIWASWHCVYLVWCSQTQPFPRKKNINTHTHKTNLFEHHHLPNNKILTQPKAFEWINLQSETTLEFLLPGTQMTSIFEGQPSKTRPFPIKTRVIR